MSEPASATRIITCGCGQRNRVLPSRAREARCGRCGEGLAEAAMNAALARAGLTFEQAEQLAQDVVRESVARYGDGAATVLAFRFLKASRGGNEDSRDAIVARLAQVILAEAR